MSLRHQSAENQAGEVMFRRHAAFGEPEKVMEIVKEKISNRRAIMESLGRKGVSHGPFLEVGSDVASTSLLLLNEFGHDGIAVDISLEALQATPEVARRLKYTKLPL